MNKQVVILTASSGGGHNAAAHALQTMIEKRLGAECQFTLIDVYRNNLFQRLPFFARVRYHSDFLWRIFLKVTNHKVIARSLALLMRPFMIHSITRQLPEHCDYLIAVHFNPAQFLPLLAEKFHKQPKTAIVATDLDPHWAWFGSGADAMYVASAAGQLKALQCGYQKHQIYALRLIPTGQIACRRPSGMTPARLRLGIVSGLDGSNPRQIFNILDILAALPNADNMDICLFCGTNTELQQQANSLHDRYAPLHLKVIGYTENLKSQIHHYDLMLIRTSPGILSECVCAGVPVVGFDWSAHEHYQKSFIQMHGIGFASKVLAELREYLMRLFTQPNALLHVQHRVARLRRQNNADAMLSHLLQQEVV